MSKKVIELSADIATLWKLQCQNLYSTSNLAALAVRECLQNSLDAVSNVQHGQIDITVADDYISVSDNGVGMTEDVIHTKFLTLGGTTKDNSKDVGGFGLAKSVILGCGTGFIVETQDNLFSDSDLGKNPIHKVPYRQGTKITMFNPLIGIDTRLSKSYVDTVIKAIEEYVLTSVIPDNVTITINDVQRTMRFCPTDQTSRLPAELGISDVMIPQNTQLKINVYPSNDDMPYLYVRLKGLTQFKTYLSWNATCNVVLDINTKISPRDTLYPFATNRESLKTQYHGLLDAIRDKMSQAPTSVAKDTRYKETLYEASPKKATEMASALVSPKICDVTRELTSLAKTIDIRDNGGYIPATIVDYIAQYNRDLEDAIDAESAGETVTKEQVIKALPKDTLIRLSSTLEYSWLVYEDTYWKHKSISLANTLLAVSTWEMILRIMEKNFYGEPGTFSPGIVLEDDTLGMCLEKYINNSQRVYVMFNPLKMPVNASVQKLALWLMGVAAHELAHYICGSFEAHGEKFSITREAIMNDNLDALENIMKIVKTSRLYKLCEESYTGKTLDELEDLAYERGIDYHELRCSYPDKRIYRMRLVMTLKKTSSK